jgi:hypothetical protein
LINAFEDLSDYLLDRSNPLLKTYPKAGIPFLARWCAGENLKRILFDSFGNIDCLDKYVLRSELSVRESQAFPKGLAVHWIAGNVPTLGLLSLILGVITKNSNLVRLPSSADGLLADLIKSLSLLGNVHKKIANAISIVRYDYSNLEIAEAIAQKADTRIIWGGDESSKSIKALSSKLTSTDLVFPDRTSFLIVGQSEMRKDRLDAVTRLIAHDASVFEQKACASPHTVFLSTDNDNDITTFCETLAKAMQHTLKAIPKVIPSEREVIAILNMRTQYDMFHDAWYSTGTEFSVLSDDKEQLGPAIGNRTLFVRRLPSDEKLIEMIPENIQSVGIAADEEEFSRLSILLGQKGVHRVTPLGAMTHFEIPWDGIDIPQYLVRWSSRQITNNHDTKT